MISKDLVNMSNNLADCAGTPDRCTTGELAGLARSLKKLANQVELLEQRVVPVSARVLPPIEAGNVVYFRSRVVGCEQ